MIEGDWIYYGWRLVTASTTSDGYFKLNTKLYKLVRLNASCINRRVLTESDLNGLIYEDYGNIIVDYNFSILDLDNIIRKYMREDKLNDLFK